MIDISILIVTYKTPELVRTTLSSIINNCKDVKYEIIVVDNGSNDTTEEIINNEFKEVRLIVNKKNLFYSPALNQASKIANGDYLLILNSDVFLADNSLNRMLKVIKNDEKVGCLTSALEENGKIVYHFWDRKMAWDFAKHRAPFSYFTKGTQNSKKIFSQKHINDETVSYVDIITDACLLIRRKLFENIGRYDESMLMYFTEDDLCIKVKKENYLIAICETIVNHHEGSFTTKNEKSKFIFKIEMNDKYVFFKKYYGFFEAAHTTLLSYIEYLYLYIIKRK